MSLNNPDFIIVGAAKSGTTTLYQYLCRHPQIYMCFPKEPDFFSLDANYARGIEWYRSLFENAEPTQICGEASTTYTRLHQYPKTAERIAQTMPKVKMIYIMRHPVDRAYSFYIHRFKASLHKPERAVLNSFGKTIEHQSEFVDSSQYYYQIQQYLQFFEEKSFLFLLMEDLIERPANTLKKIFQFLNIDDTIDLTGQDFIVANKASNYPDWYVKQELLAPLKKIAGVQTLSSLFPQNAKDNFYKMLKQARYNKWKKSINTPPPMLPETRSMLLEHFKAPNLKLAQFLDRDLSHWNR